MDAPVGLRVVRAVTWQNKVACWLVPDGLRRLFHKALIFRDLHTRPSLEFLRRGEREEEKTAVGEQQISKPTGRVMPHVGEVIVAQIATCCNRGVHNTIRSKRQKTTECRVQIRRGGRAALSCRDVVSVISASCCCLHGFCGVMAALRIWPPACRQAKLKARGPFPWTHQGHTME